MQNSRVHANVRRLLLHNLIILDSRFAMFSHTLHKEACNHYHFASATLYSRQPIIPTNTKSVKSVGAVYPFLCIACVVNQLLRFKPQLDFILGGFRAVTAMDDVSASKYPLKLSRKS